MNYDRAMPLIIALPLVLGLFLLLVIRQTINPYFIHFDKDNAYSLSVYLRDFPVYPGVSQENPTDYNKINKPVAVWDTQSDPDTITDWYIHELPRLGWHIDTVSGKTENSQLRLIAVRKVEQIVNISVIRSALTGATQIIVEFPHTALLDDD